MARLQTTPRFPVGTRVLKSFPGYAAPFGGEVDAFLPDSGFYHIRYDDGDSEEMTEDDVDRHYFNTSRKRLKAASPAPTKAATNKLQTTKSSKPRTKVLLLSAPTPDGNDDDDYEGLADGEEEEEGENEEMEQDEDEVKEVTAADEIYKLVGQRVCKRQDGGIVSGTVSSYFPATKMYRVVYTNGTIDDMTYRDVVDSIPLSASGASAAAVKSPKRKQREDGATDIKGRIGDHSLLPKKQKTDDKAKDAVAGDENVNSGNAGDADGKRRNGTVTNSIMVMPSTKEDEFVWNQSTAYDTVRTVLYIVASTAAQPLDAHKVLEQEGIKAKAALVAFVEQGGLATLQERLTSWCKAKETESGVLAILKVLAVIPGVTSDAVSSSNIGKTLNDIRKRRADYVSPLFDPLVRDMASYVIAKWKKEILGDTGSEKRTSKAAKETKSKPSQREMPPKSTKTDRIKSESSLKLGGSVTHKRSNSAGHLRDLIGGPRNTQARNGDLLGNSLNNGRPGSRPLGAPHARSARRSTVLLDSIKNRLKTAGSEKSSPTSGDRASLKPDVWTASRVKFGGHSTLEFDKEIQVSMLMISPVPGGIRPFRSKSEPAQPPPPTKQPAKSILRVKLAAAEREANAAVLQAEASRNLEATTAERMHIGTVSFSSTSTSGLPVRPSIGEDNKHTIGDIDDSGDHEEEEGEVPVVAPPSPPRKHDASEDDVGDEEEGAEDDLPPMPDDIMIGEAPSPPSSDVAGDQNDDVSGPRESMDADVEMEANGDEQSTTTDKPFTFERVASPEVSSDSSSSDSEGEAESTDPSQPAPPQPSPSPPRETIPPVNETITEDTEDTATGASSSAPSA